MNPHPMTVDSPMLSAALAYIRLGWYVFPLSPGTKQPFGRLVPQGQNDATLEPQTARSWWLAHPTAGIGINLFMSGLVAIDIDIRNGGEISIDELEAKHGKLESDVVQMTPGGGWHRVFSVPPGAQLGLPGTFGPGIDVKANGYICAEPSVHPNGGTYGWEASSNPLEGAIPSPLPDWTRSVRVRAESASASVSGMPVDQAKAAELRGAMFALDVESRDSWSRVGMALHSTGWGEGAYAMWCEWSQQSPKFNSTDQRRVWNSFADRGLGGLSSAWIFSEAQRVGWVNPRSSAVTALAPRNQAEQPSAAPVATLPMLNLAELNAASQNVRWLIKSVLPAAAVGVMFGASGTFKSFVALDAALHIAHGMPWQGKKTKQGAVVFIAAEGGTGLMKRINAWHQSKGLSWADIPFFVVPVPVMLNKSTAAVVEAAARLGVVPALVVVDTMSQTYDGEENSASEVAGYFGQLSEHFRTLWACSVMVIHHSGHAATERPRGSSAILANCDFLFGVFRDDKELLCTLTCVKQKDGDPFGDQSFRLTSEVLGSDEDGDEINSLVATHMNHAGDLLAAHQSEAVAGRSTMRSLLLSSVLDGQYEEDARKSFYAALGDAKLDTKKKAWQRVRSSGLLVITEGRVMHAVCEQPVDNISKSGVAA